MTDLEKERIKEMRIHGVSYNQMGKLFGFASSTIKSYCVRAGIVPIVSKEEAKKLILCKCCGKPVQQNPKRKAKWFCTSKCRMEWWNRNLDKVNRKAFYDCTCANCGKQFTAYGCTTRKYCSRECYLADRFE